MDRFQKTFGTVEEYLRGIGLTGEEIEALRGKAPSPMNPNRRPYPRRRRIP